MVRAFAAALEDENLLVRRSALDLLLQTLRVDSIAIRKAHADDQTILMRAATGVVLRRDLSLNRRLYSWLLGPEEKTEHQIAYLKDNALNLLSTTLKVSLNSYLARLNGWELMQLVRMKCLTHRGSTQKTDHSRYSYRYLTSGRLAHR